MCARCPNRSGPGFRPAGAMRRWAPTASAAATRAARCAASSRSTVPTSRCARCVRWSTTAGCRPNASTKPARATRSRRRPRPGPGKAAPKACIAGAPGWESPVFAGFDAPLEWRAANGGWRGAPRRRADTTANARTGAPSMDIFLQQVINGLLLVAVYALVALGYTMVYGIINLINFAHGEVLMVGALTSWTVVTALADTGWPGWMLLLISLVAAIVVCAVLNYTVEKVAYRPLRNAPRLARSEEHTSERQS